MGGGGPSFTGFGLRDRLAHALGAGPRPPAHDEAEDVFTYRGAQVRVKEKVRVESQDPSLISAMAKLAALEHTVELGRRALDVVMTKSDEGDDHESDSSAMANLYAEFLPNIKTLTVTTVLDTPRNDTTALSLSSDRTKIILEHNNRTHDVTLPARMSGQGPQNLQLPNTGESQCANRIPAEPFFGEEEPIALWSATYLNSQTRVHCKHCNALVSSDKIRDWKNLPSEAWAEMMDLWHCHKPDEPDHGHEDAPAKKGYAAGNKLRAQAGVGLVDVMSFLLSEGDCTVEVSHGFLFFPVAVYFIPLLVGFQEGVLCELCVISMRYRSDTKTQDQARYLTGEQTLGLARRVAHCVDVNLPLCIEVSAQSRWP